MGVGLLGMHKEGEEKKKGVVLVEEEEEKQLTLEEQMGKGEDRDLTATLAAFPEYRAMLLETQVARFCSVKIKRREK